MPHWSDPLFALLAAQPRSTTAITLTVDELAALVGDQLPALVYRRSYWHARGPHAIGQRLRAAGWWVTSITTEEPGATITFMRYELTHWAARRDKRAG